MGFLPRYTITNTILNRIAVISSVREFIEQSRIIPRWEILLLKEARLYNAHASTSIEGNRLTLQEVRALDNHDSVIAAEKDKQEVLNYLKALDTIPEFAGKGKIDVPLFLEIHRILTKKVIKDSSSCGKFRTRQVFVGRRIFSGTGYKDIVDYLPPQSDQVPLLVKKFLQWLNKQFSREIHPVLLAGIAHYEVARIHPFIDGNGRAARLLATLVLFKEGFDHRRFFALDDYYDKDRSSYYAALQKVQKAGEDLTGWLDYFTEGVMHSVLKVKNTIAQIGAVKQTGTWQIELSSRQMTIMERAMAKGKITNGEIRSLFPVSRQAILKDISKLTKNKLLILIGKGRGAYYMPVSE